MGKRPSGNDPTCTTKDVDTEAWPLGDPWECGHSELDRAARRQRKAKLSGRAFETFSRGIPLIDLINSLQQRSGQNKHGRVSLSREEASQIIQALQDAHEHSQLEEAADSLNERYLKALAIWNEAGNTNQRARAAWSCVVGLAPNGHKATYDPVRVIQMYQDFVMGYKKRHAFDVCAGHEWLSKSWAQLGLHPPEGVDSSSRVELMRVSHQPTAEDPERLEIRKHTRKEAITAVRHHFQFASDNAVVTFLHRYGQRNLPATRSR